MKQNRYAEQNSFDGLTVAFCLTGSFCTLRQALAVMAELRQQGARILPVISGNVQKLNSRFGTAAHWQQEIMMAAGTDTVIDSIVAAEPIGPQKLADILLIAPCTGNTLSKLANGITDTPVLMAAKAQLRTGRPVVFAIASNDGLSGSAVNLGRVLDKRNVYCVPFRQDDPKGKPNSLIAEFSLIPDVLQAALAGEQLQPVLLGSC